MNPYFIQKQPWDTRLLLFCPNRESKTMFFNAKFPEGLAFYKTCGIILVLKGLEILNSKFIIRKRIVCSTVEKQHGGTAALRYVGKKGIRNWRSELK